MHRDAEPPADVAARRYRGCKSIDKTDVRERRAGCTPKRGFSRV
jgi:hypothetical protein